jgi:hypothetical protein
MAKGLPTPDLMFSIIGSIRKRSMNGSLKVMNFETLAPRASRTTLA